MKLNPKAITKCPPGNYKYQGVVFCGRVAYPKNRATKKEPCRMLVTPHDPVTGKLLTKAQLYGGTSDQPVNLVLYGVDEEDICEHKLAAAFDLLISRMKEQGLLPDESFGENDPEGLADLGEVAANFKDTFFTLHHSEWKQPTRQEYSRQYDVLVSELSGITVKHLDQIVYKELQNTICLNSLKTAYKVTEWHYGKEPPASAAKRMALLYILIQDLKQVEGVEIPVIPTRYNSKPSRQDMLLDRTDSVRSLPTDLLRKACGTPLLAGQAGLLADAGLRISEAGGLLFDSIRAVETSQGTMFYLIINGQILSTGKRTEITKTDASYRCIPISQELGRELFRNRRTIEAEERVDLSYGLMCIQPNSEKPFQDALAWKNKVSEKVSQLLRGKDFVEEITIDRPYIFDKKAQDNEVLYKLTCHSLRRNYCTWCYCDSASEIDEIYRQMGHVNKNGPKRRYGGLTEGELRIMCLRKHVTATLYHPAQPLHYNVDGPFRATEVPACVIELNLPPKISIRLTIDDTEPGTEIKLDGEDLNIQYLHNEKKWEIRYTYALLAMNSMPIKKHKLLR